MAIGHDKGCGEIHEINPIKGCERRGNRNCVAEESGSGRIDPAEAGPAGFTTYADVPVDGRDGSCGGYHGNVAARGGRGG